MTAVISVPWSSARLAGRRLGGSQPIPTKEAPEVDRVYFLVSIALGHDHWPFPNSDAFEIQYFWDREAAMAWGERA